MPDAPPAHGAVVLAAGASRRLGQAKQLLRIGGESLVRRAARLALTTEPLATAVVVGAHADAVFAEVRDLPVRRVDSSDWRAGMGVSLQAGLAALPAACAGALIVLCDQPALDAGHLRRLCATWRSDTGRAVASGYAGGIGVPALLPRAWFADLARSGDAGARDLITRRRDEVVAVDNEALAFDIDRSEDLGVTDS